MQRPLWQGHISFGLVSIPVSLYSAEQRTDLHFKLLDNRNHSRIHYERINEATGNEVPWNEVVKGYEYQKDQYVVLSDEDFQKAAVENSHAIEIENFVDADSVDYIYFDKPYYVVPDKKSEKGYVILREVLQRTKTIGIAKVVIRTRQYLAALLPYENGMVLNLLRFSQELRDAKDFNFPSEKLSTYKITSKEINLAEQLVETMTTKWNPKAYHDDYRDALHKWIAKKLKGVPEATAPTPTKIAPGKGKVIDFMSLLKKSVSETQKHPHGHKPTHKIHRKK